MGRSTRSRWTCSHNYPYGHMASPNRVCLCAFPLFQEHSHEQNGPYPTDRTSQIPAISTGSSEREPRRKPQYRLLGPDTGCVIVDPTVSSCGRFKFAPMLAYAVDDAQVQALATINEAVHNAVVGALNAMAFEVQTLLGVTDGGFASAFFSDGELERTMREALAKYLIAELANIGDHEA